MNIQNVQKFLSNFNNIITYRNEKDLHTVSQKQQNPKYHFFIYTLRLYLFRKVRAPLPERVKIPSPPTIDQSSFESKNPCCLLTLLYDRFFLYVSYYKEEMFNYIDKISPMSRCFNKYLEVIKLFTYYFTQRSHVPSGRILGYP